MTGRLLVALVGIAFLALGICSCGSRAATVRSSEPRRETPTTARSVSSEPTSGDSTGTANDLDVAALQAKIADYLARNPGATVTSAVAIQTDRAALLALSGDTNDSQAEGTEVIVLQLRGQFPTMVPDYSMQKQPGSERLVPVPRASSRIATVLTESMSIDLDKVYDVATQYPDSKIIDLGKLNVPMVTIPLK